MSLAAVAPRARDYLEDPWEMRIFKAVRTAADNDQPCPTCDDLADLLGCSIATTVNIIQRLEKRGLIQVRRYQRERLSMCPRSINGPASL
jgi:Mn-dependent DtxR family transcriptional regulator